MQLRIYTHAHEIWSLEQFTEVKAAQLEKKKKKKNEGYRINSKK